MESRSYFHSWGRWRCLLGLLVGERYSDFWVWKETLSGTSGFCLLTLGRPSNYKILIKTLRKEKKLKFCRLVDHLSITGCFDRRLDGPLTTRFMEV